MSTAHATFETAQDFFPTPRELAETMLAPLLARAERGEDLAILDPQAGTGDLLMPFARFTSVALYAIEQSLELRTILATRLRNDCALEGLAADDPDTRYFYRSFNRETRLAHIIGEDFFAYGPRYALDAIVMNPPFTNWTEHLQHAIDIAQPNTEIYCLFPTGQKKFLVDLDIPPEVDAEIVDCGKAFADAKRPTTIEVSYISFRMPAAAATDSLGFDFGTVPAHKGHKPVAPTLDASDETALTFAPGEVDRLVIQYEHAVRALVKFSLSWRALATLGAPFDMKPGDLINGSPVTFCDFNTALAKLQRAAWEQVFSRTKIAGFMTEAMRKKFNVFQETTAALDFNATNVRNLLQTLVDSRNQINAECILDVFKTLTRHSKHNPRAGWKTNSEHKVGKKVILPHLVTEGSSSWGVSCSYASAQTADDIDRAMCMVTGRPFDTIVRLSHSLGVFCRQSRAKQKDMPAFDTEFFAVRVFQAGTVHLVFREDIVWEAFNRAAVAAQDNAASLGRE